MKSKGKKFIIASIILFVLIFSIAYFTITVYAIPPIGALPEGRTVIIWRLEGFKFIDSPDAHCMRTTQSVTILCRVLSIGTVVGGATDNKNIIVSLPYVHSLYLISTNGKEFEN